MTQYTRGPVAGYHPVPEGRPDLERALLLLAEQGKCVGARDPDLWWKGLPKGVTDSVPIARERASDPARLLLALTAARPKPLRRRAAPRHERGRGRCSMTGAALLTSFDVGSDMAVLAAESARVCIRPHVRTVTDRATGQSVSVPIPCGSTGEAVCGPCATKARRLRMHQCREAWHRTDADQTAVDLDDVANVDPEAEAEAEAEAEDDEGEQLDDDQSDEDAAEGPGRRVRSTRRLPGVPDLSTIPMDQRTTGKAFTDERSGRVFQPSMFLTLTLPSYGKVIPRAAVPVDPSRYDYRRAALDALLFPRLLDRWWQNLRRCAGYKVQYFSAIEAQRHLAPHLHAAVRGAIPRTTLKTVAKATYYAAWWPPLDRVVYAGARMPVWDAVTGCYVDPTTWQALPSWDEATDALDKPAHVARLGVQLDIKGLIGGTADSDRAVRDLCEYLTKNVADTYSDEHATHADAYHRHVDRLHYKIETLPCSPACANWLRYGFTPKNPEPGLVPGHCSSPAHDRENLGLGGRRVLVSRRWSGKTLTEHRADCRAVVSQVLEAAGIHPGDADRLAAHQILPDGTPRYTWEDVEANSVDYVAASLRQARQWREQYERAKAAAAQRGSPPVDDHSATTPPAATDAA